MRYIAISAMVALSAAPAVAQDLVFWPDPILDCLDEAVDAPMRQRCIGVGANLCMIDNPGGSSTIGMGSCLDQERAWWDTRLNDVYGSLQDQFTDRADVQENLREMQRAWITYRDARCDFEFIQWNGGTGQGPALLACLMMATAEQTLVLEDQLR